MTGVLELMLADARTPSGGYAHSAGLEPLVSGGLRATEIPAFIRARLRTVGFVEASFAAAACACPSVSGLLALDQELAARTPAEPLRRASRGLGRGLLRTGEIWFPEGSLLAEYRRLSSLSPRPICVGVLAGTGGLAPAAAARASLYDDAATVAAAAVKLLPLDAAVASGWVLALRGEIESLALIAATAGEGLAENGGFADLPSTATPRFDLRAMTHANTERRLFVS
jgi:urease accessory protein